MPGQKASEAKRREQILNAAYHVALRRGIDGLTVRAVATKAKLSHGLVLFHFKRKDHLVGALLDRVLATTTMLNATTDVGASPPELGALRALLQRELERLAREPRAMRLFFEYWALGARDATVRAKVRAALDRYRMAFRAMTDEILQGEPADRAGVTPDGLAAVAVSLVNGGAVQAMIDPEHFDLDGYVTASSGLVKQLTATATT